MTSDTAATKPARPAPASDGPADRPADAKPLGRLARWKFEALRWPLATIARICGLGGLYQVGRAFAILEYLVDYRRRRRYRAGLKRVFPEGLPAARAREIIRSYFIRTRCDKLYYLVFDKLPRERIMERVRFLGRDLVESGLAPGKGLFVMLSHHGSHHVAGLLMALMGYKCAGVRDRNEGALRRYAQRKYEETFPELAAVRILFADSFPRDIFRCFQENRVLGAALDVNRVRDERLRTCGVDLLGERREFLTGTLQIALRCGATIIQGFVVSRPNYYFDLVGSGPLAPAGAPADDATIAAVMQSYADGIAAHVRSHPDHLSRL